MPALPAVLKRARRPEGAARLRLLRRRRGRAGSSAAGRVGERGAARRRQGFSPSEGFGRRLRGAGVLRRRLPTAASRTPPPPPALQPETPPEPNRDRFETLPAKGSPSPPSRAWHCPHPPPLNPARPRRLSDRAWQLRAAGKAGGLPAARSDSPLAAAHRRAPSPSPSPPPAPHAVSPSLSRTHAHTHTRARTRFLSLSLYPEVH